MRLLRSCDIPVVDRGPQDAPWPMSLEALDRQPWMREALCAQIDPNMWFPEKGHKGLDALRICRDRCPATDECREYAMARKITHGIWGGTTRYDRLEMWRALGIDVEEDE